MTKLLHTILFMFLLYGYSSYGGEYNWLNQVGCSKEMSLGLLESIKNLPHRNTQSTYIYKGACREWNEVIEKIVIYRPHSLGHENLFCRGFIEKRYFEKDSSTPLIGLKDDSNYVFKKNIQAECATIGFPRRAIFVGPTMSDDYLERILTFEEKIVNEYFSDFQGVCNSIYSERSLYELVSINIGRVDKVSDTQSLSFSFLLEESSSICSVDFELNTYGEVEILGDSLVVP